MRKSTVRFKKLFYPEMLGIYIAVYGIVSFIVCRTLSLKFQNIGCSFLSLFLWCIFSLSISFGALFKKVLGKKINLSGNSEKILLVLSLSIVSMLFFIQLISITKNIFLAVMLVFLAFLIPYTVFAVVENYLLSFIAGICMVLFSFSIFGIPLIEGTHLELYRNLNPLFLAGFGIALISAILLFPRRKFCFFVLAVLAIISTYRAFFACVVLCYLALYFFVKNRKTADTKYLPALLIVLFGVIVFLGMIIVKTSYSSWKLGPIETCTYRMAFTFSTFERVVNASFPFGYTLFASLSQSVPGKLICKIAYNCDSNINAGFFGIIVMDLGIFAGLIAFLIGVLLQYLFEKNKKFYSFYFATTLSFLDIGISIYYFLIATHLCLLGAVLKNEGSS